ncbi:MAG: hypothetical protein ACRD2I_16900, partial [Vicinamibacterales bacterium]
FMQWAASMSALSVAAPMGTRRVRVARAAGAARAFQPNLLPTQKQVWDQQVWMARLGPKYTGNKAHTTFVEFLAAEFRKAGCDVAHDRYTLPRWDAKRWSIEVTPGEGVGFNAPVTSYFPYSGQTSAAGVGGQIVYAGSNPKFTLTGLSGKVALIDFATNTREWAHVYRPWGINPPGERFPDARRPARGAVTDLTQFQKAGAVAVILGWTDVSDANAQDQYTPFSRPPQGIPGLYVGRGTLARLRALGSGAGATVVLEAETVPDTPTDTLIATLPGVTDEVVIVNTHTDGPNATEENGALGILALAQYFSRIPKAERKRTLVFPLTTGHFAGPWVPSIRGVIEKHPDVIKRAVAAVTVEHLGCREWMDDASMRYAATGKNEWSVAITPDKTLGRALVEALQGSRDRAGVVNPVNGGWLGEGSSLSRAGIPTIGYIPQPNYLLAGPADGCIEKLSPELMHSQIQVFARLLHAIEEMSAEQLKGV